MRLTHQLKGMQKGDTLEFHLESFTRAQTIRALVYRVNKSNPKKYNLYTRLVGRTMYVINGDDESLTASIRDIKIGDSKLFDNGLYNKIHSMTSQINAKDGSEIKVKKVVQVTRES